MPAVPTLMAFAVTSAALIVVPGPAVMYIVNRSLIDGRQVGLAAVGGIEVGTLAHVLAAAFGLSAVVSTSATVFGAIKWCGVVYLVATGLRTLLTVPAQVTAGDAPMRARTAFWQGIVINLMNPKVALFFLSFLPQFIDDRAARPWLQALTLGLVFTVIAMVSDSIYAVGASALRSVLVRGRLLMVIRRWVSGSVFVGLGVIAATARRANR